MSKLYKKYLELKENNSEKLYLFHSGIFYIFLDQDAQKVANQLGLKLTKFTDQIYKCGFPENSFIKYKNRLKELELDYEIIGSKEMEKVVVSPKTMRLLERIKKMDMNEITPMKALTTLTELVEELK